MLKKQELKFSNNLCKKRLENMETKFLILQNGETINGVENIDKFNFKQSKLIFHYWIRYNKVNKIKKPQLKILLLYK